MERQWNGTFSSTPITVYDTLILNSSGNPIKGTTPRSASLQFWEKWLFQPKPTTRHLVAQIPKE